jgi:hypothetical protein
MFAAVATSSMLVSSYLSKDVRPGKSLPMNSSAPEMTGVVAEQQAAERRDRRAQQDMAADGA